MTWAMANQKVKKFNVDVEALSDTPGSRRRGGTMSRNRGYFVHSSSPVKIDSIYIDSELCHHNIMLCVVCFVGYRITSDFKTIKPIAQQGAHLRRTQNFA